MNYSIGREYRYPNNKKRFRLISTNGIVFRFECGHWCTDNVFLDLIDCTTGIQVYNNNQLSLNLK